MTAPTADIRPHRFPAVQIRSASIATLMPCLIGRLPRPSALAEAKILGLSLQLFWTIAVGFFGVEAAGVVGAELLPGDSRETQIPARGNELTRKPDRRNGTGIVQELRQLGSIVRR
jgi:hypothetical protein